MREFKTVNKTFIKSNNSTTKIFNRYLYCLIPFILLIVVYNLIWGSSAVVINLLKSIVVSIITSVIVGYIFNLVRKEKSINKLLFKDNLLTIAIIIGLFSIESSLIVVIIASLVSTIVRNVFKHTTISSSLYGILIILLVSYFTKELNTPLSNLKSLSYVGTYDDVLRTYGSILSYSLGLKYYLSPLLAMASFIYLFYKRSIKYSIVFSYVLTFSFMMLVIGLFNGMNIWYLFFQLCTGNILFLVVFGLTDYSSTPITYEGQVLYGIILGIITCVLRFIVPELSVVITLILGPLVLTKVIDNMSVKLKETKNYYLTVLISSVVALVSSIIITLMI